MVNSLFGDLTGLCDSLPSGMPFIAVSIQHWCVWGAGEGGNNPVTVKSPFTGYSRARCLETALICFIKVTKRQAKVTERQVFSAELHSGHRFSGKRSEWVQPPCIAFP